MIRLKYNSLDTDIGLQMMYQEQEFCFCYWDYWYYTHICLQSNSADLEQVTTHYDCFKKVSVQFLLTDTHWKGGTLDKSLLISELGQVTVKLHSPTAAFSFYLVQQVSSIGCHWTRLVSICAYWHKSRSETFLKLKYSSKFWNCRMGHNTQFCLFFWLRAITCFIFGHRYIVFMESLLFKQLLNSNRMASKKFNLVFVS